MGLFFGKRAKRGCWICHEHLFSGDSYECSLCHCSFKKRTATCPGCGAEMTSDKYDPNWVDELEIFDMLLGD